MAVVSRSKIEEKGLEGLLRMPEKIITTFKFK